MTHTEGSPRNAPLPHRACHDAEPLLSSKDQGDQGEAARTKETKERNATNTQCAHAHFLNAHNQYIRGVLSTHHCDAAACSPHMVSSRLITASPGPHTQGVPLYCNQRPNTVPHSCDKTPVDWCAEQPNHSQMIAIEGKAAREGGCRATGSRLGSQGNPAKLIEHLGHTHTHSVCLHTFIHVTPVAI